MRRFFAPARYNGSGDDILAETGASGNSTAARLTSVTSSYSDPNNPPNLISAMHYNAFGGLTSDTLGSGETETYAYVPKLTRLQSYTASYNNSPIYSFNITSFAPNGNVLSVTDTANGNWNYSYDQFNRLVCANLASNGTCTMPPAGTPTYTYVYDRFGNRWQQNGPHAFIASFTGNSSTNNNRMDGRVPQVPVLYLGILTFPDSPVLCTPPLLDACVPKPRKTIENLAERLKMKMVFSLEYENYFSSERSNTPFSASNLCRETRRNDRQWRRRLSSVRCLR